MAAKIDSKTHIIIKGARENNLKNVDLNLPKNNLIVITGLSGSGKSSLAFDTLYAEGQRRYVESLSSYARQFLGRLDKPEVDQIKGISPAVAIEQKVISTNPRSTVGTVTEVYDYLKLLFARIGKTISPKSGKEVKRHRVKDVMNAIHQYPENTKIQLFSPLVSPEGRNAKKHLEILQQQGYSRIEKDGQILQMADVLAQKNPKLSGKWRLLIDRFVVKKGDEDNDSRIADSVETAFFEGLGECIVQIIAEQTKELSFNNRFELDGMSFEEPSIHFFSFNNPLGACKTCEGFGKIIGIDKDLVIPDQSKSVYEDAIVCWKGDKMKKWKNELLYNAEKFQFPVHKPIHDLSPEQYELLWTGNQYFKGLNKFFRYLESKMYKIQYRVMLSRYRGKTTCPDCKGFKLRKDANYVKVGGVSITDISAMPINEAIEFFDALKLDQQDADISKRILTEIKNRLHFLNEVGLGYLTLNRGAATLSGGESQRINLATSLGSNLVGSMYILDEPSIGLHPRDTKRLISVLANLKDLGNTVIVVEHDEDIMEAADYLIDIGPDAGSNGGEVVFAGRFDQLLKKGKSHTARYLSGQTSIPIPKKRRVWKRSIQIKGARSNNLKGIDIDIPLNNLTVITGVSGSGKSSLVKNILYPALKKRLDEPVQKPGPHQSVEGDLRHIEAVEYVDQNPIGKSSRSNPVTYVKAYDEIRALFASQHLSKVYGFKPAHFSFNVPGGRCEVCQGEGVVKIEMQFMADVYLECENCKGKRFKSSVLEVEYHGKNIADILDMTVDDAIAFFSEHQDSAKERKLIEKLQPLQEVGMGYVQLGQSSNTLSGGEAQRTKLAAFLSKGSRAAKTLFIFDEPSTGLHFHDINKLLHAMNALIQNGHSVVVIEHHPDIIKCADWVIDLGPEGGKQGGELVFAGVPEELILNKKSYTGQHLKNKFNHEMATR